MSTNQHFIPCITVPGITTVHTNGMASEDFNIYHAMALEVLLGKYPDVNQDNVVIHDDTGLFYLVDAAAVGHLPQARQHTFTVEQVEDLNTAHLLMLNFDDTARWVVDEDLLPPQALIEILEFLCQLQLQAARLDSLQPDCPTLTDYLSSIDRAGHALSQATNPSWDDYKDLLQLQGGDHQ